MAPRIQRCVLTTAGGAMLLAAAACGTQGGSGSAPPPPMTVSAQQAQVSGETSGSQANIVTLRATVKAIDQAKRRVTLAGPEGQAITLKVGDAVQNLAQVKPGDVVVVRFLESIAFVIEPPGTRPVEDLQAVAAARAAPGQLPAGGVATTVVVSGTVVGVNPVMKTVTLANRDGGDIRTIYVQNPDNQRLLPQLRLGEVITAAITEAVAVQVERAP